MTSRRDPQTERKLRPLYDALDNLNNKQAIQRADKILKKEKDFYCAKVLKALAMVRLMKVQEAIALLDEVKLHFPLDECTLQAMSVCYKELLIPENIPYLYETALQHTPNSEDYMTQLFMGYVRIKDYKKQQQVATRLHKLTGTTAYSYWNAVSLIFMGRENPDLGKVMCFPLALKIIEKSKEKSAEIPEEVFRLYLEILDMLGMQEKAIEELEDSTKNIIIDERERVRLKIEFNKKIGNTRQCNILYKKAVIAEPDCYDFYRGYFDTAFELLTDSTTPHDPECLVDSDSADTSVKDMTALLLKVTDEAGVMRGPDLAKAELVVRLREQGIAMCVFASPALLVLQYVQKFGHKLCAYSDLTVIIDRLQETEKAELIEILEEYRTTVKESNGTKAMQRLGTLHLLLHHLGKYSSLEEEQHSIALQEIVNFHQITMEDDLGCTYIDTFTLLYAWQKADTGRKADVVDAIKLLVAKLDQYPEAAACRTLATRLYECLGAIGPAVEMYIGLDTKSIQLDSLAHLLYPSLIPLGAFHRADKQARQMESFYRTNEREVIEYVVKSYLCGRFHKVTELFELHQSMVYSISKSVFLLDKLWLSFLLTSATSWEPIEVLLDAVREELPMVKTTGLIDNRDYLVNEVCDVRHHDIATLQKETSYSHDTLYVQMRSFMLNSLLALQDATATKEEGRIEELLLQFKCEVVEKAAALKVIEGYPIYLMMSQSMSFWPSFLELLSTIVEQSYNFTRHVIHGSAVQFDFSTIHGKFSDMLVRTRAVLLGENGVNSPNLPYLSCLVQCLCFTLLCLSFGGTMKVPRKRRAIAESAMSNIKQMFGHVMVFCEECVFLTTDHKLDSLDIDKDDSVDSRLVSSVEWTLDETQTVLLKLSGLATALHAKLAPKS